MLRVTFRKYGKREEFYLLQGSQLTHTVSPVLQTVTLNQNKTAVQVSILNLVHGSLAPRAQFEFQLLEEICKLNSLGLPVYQLHTCQMGGKLLYLSHITVKNCVGG